jgi:hypothetical protein
VEGYILLAINVLLLMHSAMAKETEGGSEHVRGEERKKMKNDGRCGCLVRVKINGAMN